MIMERSHSGFVYTFNSACRHDLLMWKCFVMGIRMCGG